MTDPTPDVPTLRRLLAEATPVGDWEHFNANEGTMNHPGWMIANPAFHNPPANEDEPWIAVELHTGIEADAALIVAAVNALPGILDRLEAAEGAVARVEALDFESVIDEHFVMWHEMGGIDEPPGEWRCQCGLKFGFSPTAVQHVATALRATLAEVTP